jgi:hypothetical protein
VFGMIVIVLRAQERIMTLGGGNEKGTLTQEGTFSDVFSRRRHDYTQQTICIVQKVPLLRLTKLCIYNENLKLPNFIFNFQLTLS